jgi:hypothetical protein
VWLALLSFYQVGYKHVSERHKCLVVAGTYLPVRGMPYSKNYNSNQPAPPLLGGEGKRHAWMMSQGVGFTWLFHLLLSGHNPADFIDTSDPQSGTLAQVGHLQYDN